MRGSYTSIGQYILPKAVHFRAIAFAPLLFKCAGTTPLGFALLFPTLNVHSFIDFGITSTRFKQIDKCPVYLIWWLSQALVTLATAYKKELIFRNEPILAPECPLI